MWLRDKEPFQQWCRPPWAFFFGGGASFSSPNSTSCRHVGPTSGSFVEHAHPACVFFARTRENKTKQKHITDPHTSNQGASTPRNEAWPLRWWGAWTWGPKAHRAHPSRSRRLLLYLWRGACASACSPAEAAAFRPGRERTPLPGPARRSSAAQARPT